MSGTAALGVLIAMVSGEPTGLASELEETFGEVEHEHRWFTARARIGNEDGELMPDGFLLTELTAVARVRPWLDVELQVHNSIDEDWREAQLAAASSSDGGHGMPLSTTLTATASF